MSFSTRRRNIKRLTRAFSRTQRDTRSNNFLSPTSILAS